MKKIMLFFLSIITVVFCTMVVFAQDSTGTGASAPTLPANVVWVLTAIVAVYEVAARLIPTIRNYSLLGLIIQLIQYILPNRTAAASKTTKLP